MDNAEELVETKTFLSEETIAALKANDVEKLKSLRESGESLGFCDPSGNNLLHLAIQYSQNTSTLEAFEYLLTLSEINKESLNFEASSPLMCAFLDARDNPDYAIKLLESDTLFTKFPTSNSLLHLAVWNDWPEVMELLIEKGFDIDTKNYFGTTALHYAAQSQNTDLVWMLLFYGADPDIIQMFIDTTEFIRYPLTFFDIIHNSKHGLSLEQFSKYEKKFGLRTLVKAMEGDDDSFYQLIEITCNILYNIDELNFFLDRLKTFKSNLLKRFVQKFGFVVQDAFHKCSLERLFYNFKATMLQNLCDNLLILLDSEISSAVIDEVDKSSEPILLRLIYLATDKKQKELMAQVLCCFLSYGANMTSEVMERVFLHFNCELFGIMLHMNIEEKDTCQLNEVFFSKIFYDIEIDLDNFLSSLSYHEATKFHLNKYCTAPVVFHLRFPSLAELARNASRRAIIRKFQPKNSMQFYTILYRLPIGRVYQDIIGYARPIYNKRLCPESDMMI